MYIDSPEVIHIPWSPLEQIQFHFCAGAFGQPGFSNTTGIRAYRNKLKKYIKFPSFFCLFEVVPFYILISFVAVLVQVGESYI